jgi:lysophospholipase L1-like esterase
MQKIKNIISKINKISPIIILWNIIIVIALFLILEYTSSIILDKYYYRDFALNYDAYSDKALGKELIKEDNSIKAIYLPHVGFTTEPNFFGKHINIENSLRKTANPCSTQDSVKIFVFGGSTVWGSGARDSYTIPSFISKKMCKRGVNAKVTNFGVRGYGSTKDMISLMLELRKGNVPDKVIFYGGFNEIYPVFQNGFVGSTWNMQNRIFEFNLKDKINLKGYILHSDTVELLSKTDGLVKAIIPKKPLYQDEERIEALSDEIISVYFNNVKIIKALEKEYGFKAYFFWQPVIYLNKPLTDKEKLQARLDIKLLAEPTYKKIPKQNSELNFYDISDVFKEVNEDIYIDFVHLSEHGNELVAERITDIVFKKSNLIIKSKKRKT